MVSTSGHELLPNSAIKTLCNTLIPLATLVTPNIPEAHLMLQEADMPAIDVDDLDGLKQLAIAVRRLGAKHVLLKGGHLPLDSDHKVARSDSRKKIVCNVLCTGDAVEILEFPFSPSKNTHGTGCSLASAIACNLALGHTMLSSVRSACRYVDAGIRTAPSLGTGSGPINHFHSLQRLPFTPGAFVEYLLERDDVVPAWRAFTHHEFVEHMGDGTLEPERYKYYMIQDYLYLRHFARANALAGYKSKDLADVARAAEIVLHIQQETKLHVGECAALGVTQEEMETFEEHQACTAYTRYVLDIGQSEDWLALQISLLPCLLGYAVIAKRLLEAQAKREAEGKGENRYGKWIRNYVAEDYTQAVQKGCGKFSVDARGGAVFS
jgi:thiaminase